MELYQLRYFVKVAEMEHMTRASKELNLSEPALSRGIRHLEDELGTKLFIRRGRSIVLTESGTLLLSRAREVLKGVDDLQAEVRGVPQLRQPVRLVSRAAASLLPPLLVDFCRENPSIPISVIQNDNDIIRNHEYDLMLGWATIHPSKHSSVVLLDDPFRILLPEDHPLASQSGIYLEQLAGESMIGLTPNRFISTLLSTFLEGLSAPVRRPIYSDDALMIRNLVARGLGFAILPVFALGDDDKQGLREVAILDPIPKLHLTLSWKPEAHHPESVRRFRRFVIDYFRSRFPQLP